MMTIYHSIEVIERAAKIHFKNRMLFGLEATINKWLTKKNLPYRVDGAYFTLISVKVKLKPTDNSKTDFIIIHIPLD